MAAMSSANHGKDVLLMREEDVLAVVVRGDDQGSINQ